MVDLLGLARIQVRAVPNPRCTPTPDTSFTYTFLVRHPMLRTDLSLLSPAYLPVLLTVLSCSPSRSPLRPSLLISTIPADVPHLHTSSHRFLLPSSISCLSSHLPDPGTPRTVVSNGFLCCTITYGLSLWSYQAAYEVADIPFFGLRRRGEGKVCTKQVGLS